MTKGQVKPNARPAPRRRTDTGGALSSAKDDETAFAEVVGLIRAARQRAAQAVNTAVVDLYWYIGQHLHHKIEADGWAKGTVVQLAAYVARGRLSANLASAGSPRRTCGACGSSTKPIR